VRVLVKPAAGADGAQTLALCWSEGRTLKDRAIRERAQAGFLADIEKLQRRIASGRLRQEAKIHEAIGRLKERYSRVARYYQIHYEPAAGLLSWREDQGRVRRKPKPLMAATCSRRAAVTWTPRKSGAPTSCLPVSNLPFAP
jgi:hypothetical protein